MYRVPAGKCDNADWAVPPRGGRGEEKKKSRRGREPYSLDNLLTLTHPSFFQFSFFYFPHSLFLFFLLLCILHIFFDPFTMASQQNGAPNGATSNDFTVKAGLAQMLKGGVIMDVVNAEQVRWSCWLLLIAHSKCQQTGPDR